MKRATVRRLVVIAIAAAAAAMAVVAAIRSATAAPGHAEPPPDPGTTRSEIQPAPATDYWTPGRMRSARPAPMPEDNV